MNAQESEWSVTLYAESPNHEEDIGQLRILLNAARARKIPCGSVGVIPLPPRPTGHEQEEVPEPTFAYIAFMSTDWPEVSAFLCAELGVNFVEKIPCEHEEIDGRTKPE